MINSCLYYCHVWIFSALILIQTTHASVNLCFLFDGFLMFCSFVNYLAADHSHSQASCTPTAQLQEPSDYFQAFSYTNNTACTALLPHEHYIVSLLLRIPSPLKGPQYGTF